MPDSIWQTQIPFTSYRSVIATDINSPDGKDEKEIIIRSDVVKKSICIIDCRGEILCIIDENVGASYGVPAVADLDNDEYKEIIAGTNNKMFVWSNEGILKNGKALFEDINNRDISSTPVVCDFNNDGKNEILATSRDLGLIYLWKTLGSSSSIEWGRSLFNSENTSEYIGGYRDQLVVTHDFLWQGGEFTNDIIIRSGIFTIPENVTLAMRRPYRIYVMDGAELRVIGGRIENADILVKEGASISITNDSEVYLRSSGGKIATEIGANVNILSGLIE